MGCRWRETTMVRTERCVGGRPLEAYGGHRAAFRAALGIKHQRTALPLRAMRDEAWHWRIACCSGGSELASTLWQCTWASMMMKSKNALGLGAHQNIITRKNANDRQNGSRYSARAPHCAPRMAGARRAAPRTRYRA